MKSGAELIAEEREEQIEVHGYPIQHDAEYNDYYELAVVAQCLIMPPNQEVTLSEELNMLNSLAEQWDQEVLAKMLQKSYKERLIIAGALLAAEIDRLQYMEEGGPNFFDDQDELAKRITDAAENFPEAVKGLDFTGVADPDWLLENPGYNNGRFHPVDLSPDTLYEDAMSDGLTLEQSRLLGSFLRSMMRTEKEEGENFKQNRWGNVIDFEPTDVWVKAFNDHGYFISNYGDRWKISNYNPEEE